MAISSDGFIVITGASQGIGRTIAVELASVLPNPVLLVARNNAGLLETQKLCKEVGHSDTTVFSCDLTKEDEVDDLVQKLSNSKLAALINNAGAYLEKNVFESESDDYIKMFEVNALAPIVLTNKALQTFDTNCEGRIIFISSVTAKKGQARCGAYSSGKSALQGYIESLRESLLETKIAVTSIILGQTFSTSWDGIDVDPERLIDAADIGKTIASICSLSGRTCIEELTIRPQKGDL